MKVINTALPLFITINFICVDNTNSNEIELRQSIDEKIFESLKENYQVKNIKLKEKKTEIQKKNTDLYFCVKKILSFFPFQLFKYIKKSKPDIIFIHGFVFPIQVFCLHFFLNKKIKIIVQHHAEKPSKNLIKRWLQKISYRKVHAYLFASKQLAKPFLEAKIINNENSIHEVMECSTLFKSTDKYLAREKLNLNAVKTIFLWVGRLDANKDPLTVINAFTAYSKKNRNFKLYMAYGTNDLELDVKQLIDENQLNENIVLLGNIPHENLEDWYNAADFYVSASHYEGSGVALCEAMACGCIPIVSKIDSFIKMTNNGKVGILFECGDADDLFLQLVSIHQLNIEKMKTEVLNEFHQSLSIKAIGEKLLDITKIL
jgi:glycosyltransferase involved in cell wall biosynthesis